MELKRIRLVVFEHRPIRIGLDITISPCIDEVKYVFRTLLRIAGYPYEFVWVHESNREQALDIYYGQGSKDTAAEVANGGARLYRRSTGFTGDAEDTGQTKSNYVV